MAKQTGIGARLWVGAYDISGDTGAIDNIAGSRAQIDVTAIRDDYFSRLPGLGDGEISFTGFFNQAGAHGTAALSAMGTAALIATASFAGTVGASAASLSGAEASYGVQRGTDGSLATSVDLLSFAGYGVEWGKLLTAGTVSATGTASTTLDNAASSTNGGAAYLHVFSVTAGTVTVTVQDSPDNSSFSNVTGLSFTATNTGTAQRVATAAGATINRYTRINVSGGTAVLAVNFARG